MKNYDVYFELYGKKMKATILAESEVAAREAIKNKITFHKVVLKAKDEFNDVIDMMDAFINGLGGEKK